MGKGKKENCVICGKPIKRHDVMRENVTVGYNNGEASHREVHLSCSQKKQENKNDRKQ